MKLYVCSVKLGDSNNHVVPNKKVTIPEIAVLRRIHGAPAIINIRPANEVKTDADGRTWTDSLERERLTKKYQRSTEDGGVNIVELFGALGALPKSLREIGIDPAAAAADMRRQAEEMSASAAQLADEDDAPPAVDEDEFFDEAPVTGKKAA